MAIFLDFVGLNTLIHDPISSSVNTIGYPFESASTDYINDIVASITDEEYLAALNIHRNGPYGYSTFKQIRASQNPLTRYHNANSIFSYVRDGLEIQTNGRETFIPKRTQLRQIVESPIISNNKPLTLVGGVSEYNRRTGKTTIERVEVQASPTNEIQFFGDDQTNREFGTEYETDEVYEDLTNLYLDGGIESDDSPIDQFELLRYQHQIYPREGNTYLAHIRGRENFISGYWRDERADRTQISSSEGDLQNGFGFSVPSQSMWPLDVEEGWATRDLASTIGSMTMSAPTEITFGSLLQAQSDLIDAIRIDPDGVSSNGDEIYLHVKTYTNSVTGYNYYNTSPPYGQVTAERYTINSSRGVQRFYDAWTGLMEDAGFRIDSTNPSIDTRDNVDATTTTFVSNDPYYLEIDNVAGASHFTTELSHSLVHWWTKDENFIDGYIYREMDASGEEKRSIQFNNSDIRAKQAPIFKIIEEDGTETDFITGSTLSDGLLLWNYPLSSYSSLVGNEWNNKIVSFGDPNSEGDESIKFYSNGTLVTTTDLTDNLCFFDSGVTRTTHLGYDDGTTFYSYLKGATVENDGYLEEDFGSGDTMNANREINIGFFYRSRRTSFEADVGTGGHEHRIIFIGNQDGTDTSYSDNGLHVFLVGTYDPITLSYKPSLKLKMVASFGTYKEATFSINNYNDKLTKYLVYDYGNAQNYPKLSVWDEDTKTYKDLTPIAATVDANPSSAPYATFPAAARYIVHYDPNNYNPTPQANLHSSANDQLAEIVYFTGSYGTDFTLEEYFKGESSVDFTSSYWPIDVMAWYRYGNGSSDNTTSFFTIPSGGSISDYSGNSRDLSAVVNNYDIAILTYSDEGNRTSQKPIGFQTGSIGEAYVLCETSSTNNSSTDYFQNAKIAELAIFPSQSNTDITEYISAPFYQLADLTGSGLTTTASIWYAFDDLTDSIAADGASIINQNTSFSTFQLTGAYSSATGFPTIENDGLLVTGSTSNVIDFKIKYSYMQDNTSSLGAASTGILNYVSSSITGDITNLYIGGAVGYNAQLGPGVLMNSYNAFNIEPIPVGTSTDLDTYLSAACLYTRRHTLITASSFQHPFVATDYTSFFQPGVDDYEEFELYQGMAQWDAPTQANKKPFYDDYGRYAAEMRLTNKDYTVVPEYRISQHVDKFLLKGDTEFNDIDNAMLEVTGGHQDKWNSDLDGFYETYSTTDFLKMFDLIQEEHDDFVNPISLKLKCKGVKKFLPYKGFYPADRTVEISQQFYDSYGDYLTVSSSYSASNDNYAVQNLLTPLFSPGILFNTIKSGVACDYPIMTGSFTTSSVDDPLDPGTPLSGTYTINEQFHKRIPFEALIEPEKYLANQPLYPQEPDPLGDLDMTVTWNGGGDEKYRLMVSNFLAETGEFFLRNKDFASISSLPEGDPNFGNAEAGKTYAMRIKMYRTISGDKALWETDNSETYNSPQPEGGFSVPQDTGSMEQAFMMYSRPSAFGPPQRLTISGGNSYTTTLKFTNWADYKRQDSIDTFYKITDSLTITEGPNALNGTGFEDLAFDYHNTNSHFLIGNDADAGYNYPFTPPYYHGEAWADVTFQANNTEKLSLSQIINSSSVEFLRFYEPVPVAGHTEPDHFHTNWRLVNEDAMQIASSVNIFSKGVLKQDITQTKRQGIRNDVQVQVDTNVGNQYRWIIQSKFETPILNFKKYTHRSSDVTMPFNSPDTTPIGMWHQYGELPQNPNEGVFMQVAEVPDQWIDNAMNAKSYQTGSLVELCGFSTDPVRLGDVAPTKTIKEAVVAIPFVERSGQRQFFTIDREDVQNALEPSTKNLVGKTIQDMVQRMKDYVFPPSMDFINNDDIDPFAMYIFEFKHTLDKQDLADIWQNLPPDIGQYHEEAEAVISHELLAHELLGGKADLKPGRNTEFELNRQVRKDKIDSKIRWMIFKVKQRAKTNYFEKIFARNESQEAGAQLRRTTLSSTGASKNASYNWPYDYFSLVELIKMDAEIDFARPDDENQEEKLVIKPFTKVVSNSTNQTILNNALFGTNLPEPEPPQGVIQERIPKGKKRK